MSGTGPYRQQHADLIRRAAALTARLDPGSLAEDPARVHGTLDGLAAALRLHLVQEDAELYPRLLRHPDRGVRDLARTFQEEMGRIHGDFEAFLGRWPSPGALSEDPYGFAVEALSILDVLHRRIHLEDTALYPRVDAAEGEGP